MPDAAEMELPEWERCSFCLGGEGFDLPVCGLCKKVTYCSETCLKRDLKNHERDCWAMRWDRVGAMLRDLKVKPVSSVY